MFNELTAVKLLPTVRLPPALLITILLNEQLAEETVPEDEVAKVCVLGLTQVMAVPPEYVKLLLTVISPSTADPVLDTVRL